MQTRELKEYCDRRGWEIAGEFTDQASGAKESRPALNRLMAVHCGIWSTCWLISKHWASHL
jgi:hypothetical protein